MFRALVARRLLRRGGGVGITGGCGGIKGTAGTSQISGDCVAKVMPTMNAEVAATAAAVDGQGGEAARAGETSFESAVGAVGEAEIPGRAAAATGPLSSKHRRTGVTGSWAGLGCPFRLLYVSNLDFVPLRRRLAEREDEARPTGVHCASFEMPVSARIGSSQVTSKST